MLKQKDVLFILILTFITVVAWIGFHIHHIMVTSTIEEDLQMQIIPINPDFDTNTIENLKTRERIEPLNSIDTETAPTSPAPTGAGNSGQGEPDLTDDAINPTVVNNP